MNIKSMIVMNVEKDGKTFSFSMEAGSSFGAAYDSAHQILQDITEMSKQANDRAKMTEVPQEPKE